jgi:hypothetical protein
MKTADIIRETRKSLDDLKATIDKVINGNKSRITLDKSP